jgi:hypothetical protein
MWCKVACAGVDRMGLYFLDNVKYNHLAKNKTNCGDLACALEQQVSMQISLNFYNA